MSKAVLISIQPKWVEKIAKVVNEVAFVQAHEENGDEHLCEVVAKAIYTEVVEPLKKEKDLYKQSANEMNDKFLQAMNRADVFERAFINFLEMFKEVFDKNIDIDGTMEKQRQQAEKEVSNETI